MDLFIGNTDLELVKSFLSKAAQANLTSYLIIVWVVWQVMGKKVSEHFKGLELSVTRIAEEMRELKAVVTADLALQSKRVEQIETSVNTLKMRVEKLEDT